jgi:hypothetical protein
MDELGWHLDKKRTFDDMDESEREFAFLHARAAIEAMREPTHEMMGCLGSGIVNDIPTIDIWYAVIQQALK